MRWSYSVLHHCRFFETQCTTVHNCDQHTGFWAGAWINSQRAEDGSRLWGHACTVKPHCTVDVLVQAPGVSDTTERDWRRAIVYDNNRYFCERLYVWIIDLHVISAAFGLDYNTAVTVGSSVTFTCSCTTESSEPFLFWTFTRYDFRYLSCKRSSDVALITPKCIITFSNENRTSLLTINDVQLRHAGQYRCRSCWGEPSADEDQQLSAIGKKWKFVHI